MPKMATLKTVIDFAVTYFMWSWNPYNAQTTGWVNFHVIEQVWEITENSQVLLYLTDLELVGTHAIDILWKAITFPGCGILRSLEVIRKPKQFPEHESSKMLYYGNIIGKTALFPYYRPWLKFNWVRQPAQFPDMGN